MREREREREGTRERRSTELGGKGRRTCREEMRNESSSRDKSQME